ncbi:hypothetical protein ES707_15855 [subsurface metagenome]
MTQLVKFRGWNFCDWESFSQKRDGHDKIIQQLEKIFRSEYHLKIEKFNRKEAWIAEKHKLRNPHYYVAHKPDIIITNGGKPEDRIVIEYVNSKSLFLFDLRGMLALSTIMKRRRGFVLAIRHSIYKEGWPTILSKDSHVEIMSLKSLLDLLDHGDLDALVA